MKLKPILNRILVKIIEEDDKTSGGIYLAKQSDPELKRMRKGEIVAVGPGTYDDEGNLKPVSLKVGQIALFTRLGGIEAGDGYRVYADSEALALIES